MLEFSSEPYRFYPPKPSGPVIALAKPLNRLLLRHDLKVVEQEITGATDSVRERIGEGARLLFTPNHPTRTDPQFTGHIQHQLGTHSSFMAAYDVFLESRIQGWLMQGTGSFSIDREGNDRKAMSTAMDILKKGEMALTIFPEGNVYHLNDRITPILDGPSFIAAKAQQSLGDDADVWIVPVSLKYTLLSDIRTDLWEALDDLRMHSGFSSTLDRSDPVLAVRSLGSHLISTHLREKTRHTEDIDFTGLDRSGVQDRILTLARKLIRELEEELELEADEANPVLDRIRKIRGRLHQLRTDGDLPTDPERARYRALADRSILAFRLLAYVIPYLADHPTLDRFAETVTRIREDYHSRIHKPVHPRKAVAHIAEPISVRRVIEANGGKTRRVIGDLTRQIETALQQGIDEINERNDKPGSQLVR